MANTRLPGVSSLRALPLEVFSTIRKPGMEGFATLSAQFEDGTEFPRSNCRPCYEIRLPFSVPGPVRPVLSTASDQWLALNRDHGCVYLLAFPGRAMISSEPQVSLLIRQVGPVSDLALPLSVLAFVGLPSTPRTLSVILHRVCLRVI